MEQKDRPRASIEYESHAPPAPKSRLPSPWLIPTLAGNPFFWVVASIAITLMVIMIRVMIRALTR